MKKWNIKSNVILLIKSCIKESALVSLIVVQQLYTNCNDFHKSLKLSDKTTRLLRMFVTYKNVLQNRSILNMICHDLIILQNKCFWILKIFWSTEHYFIWVPFKYWMVLWGELLWYPSAGGRFDIQNWYRFKSQD